MVREIPVCRCGNSGLLLPMISLGLWHSFGNSTPYNVQRDIILTSFEQGIYHFDLANVYGPPDGCAEETFGRIFHSELASYRDVIIIATKAGAPLGDGPYKSGGSIKHLLSQLDKSLQRLGLDYVDIFYHHRPDPYTDIHETAEALNRIVRSGKALYIGVSNYSQEQLEPLALLLKNLGVPCVICQPNYSMLKREYVTSGLKDAVNKHSIGSIAYSILAQGILSGKYSSGIPADSRIALDGRYLTANDITNRVKQITDGLTQIARQRGQTLAQMALVWALQTGDLTSALIGASKPEQVIENAGALDNRSFSNEELTKINSILEAGS